MRGERVLQHIQLYNNDYKWVIITIGEEYLGSGLAAEWVRFQAGAQMYPVNYIDNSSRNDCHAWIERV
jgi:hypothetical protein